MKKTLYHGTKRNFNNLEIGHDNNFEYYGDAVYFSEHKSVANSYGDKTWVLNIDLEKYNVVELNANNKVIRKIENDVKELINSNNDVVIIRNVADNNIYGSFHTWINFDAVIPSDKFEVEGEYMFENIKNTKANREKLSIANIEFDVKNGKLYIKNRTKEVATKLNSIGFEVKKCYRDTPEFFDTYIIKNQSILNMAKKESKNA